MNMMMSNHDEIVAEIQRRLDKEFYQEQRRQESRNQAAMVGWFMILLLFTGLMLTR